MLCAICKGKGLCGKPCPILAKLKKFQPKVEEHFSGSSPPEIFVGTWQYPNIFAGILSPAEYGDTSELSMPELWHEKNASIADILSFRSRMIYSRFKTAVRKSDRIIGLMKEIAISSKPVSTEFFLKKKPMIRIHFDMHLPLIGNPAPLLSARLEENPHIEKKVDYLTGDYELKASEAMIELHKTIPTSNIIKILSAGMLGLKIQRKLVPTRWATTSVDSIISNHLLKKIKNFQEISSFMLFHSEYVGNHYEILLLPSSFSFEVMEAKMPGSVWNPDHDIFICQDYENFFGRRTYASNCGGGYYAPRLAAAEYLFNGRKQASVLVMRECREEYFAPCGVGILRETCREAFKKKPEMFSTLKEALQAAQKRILLPVKMFEEKSKLLNEYKKQKKIFEFA